MSKPFVLLTVLDGWGMAPAGPGNAISQAKTPNINRFWVAYPHTQLRASGEAVGLPRGEVGNTETGHLNLGAGRIVYQDLARINMSIADSAFFENETLLAACRYSTKNNTKLHFMGLLGPGGVHSSIEHLFALIHLAHTQRVKNLFIHIFTDGRDSPPNASMAYVSQLKEVLAKEGIGEIASIMGRYWAMDRDLRWDRTQKAYFALTKGEGKKSASVEEAIRLSYENSISDEFIEPTLIVNSSGKPKAVIGASDSVIFFNFRIDRPRQLTRAFVMDNFEKASQAREFDPYAVEYEHKHEPPKKDTIVFKRGPKISNLFFVMMTEYSRELSGLGAKVAFPPENVKMPLGRVVALNNMRQLRAAESEKERFVTYYFNGQNERADMGEDRIIVPSPKVATYDLKPEMSAYELTRAVYTRLVKDHVYSFALVNFANADMVGHTGNLSAAIKSVEAVDACIGELSRFILAYGGVMLVTADHGNAEEMIMHNGEVSTEHSNNPVPFIAVSKDFVGKAQMLPFGILADIAPTICALLGVSPATAMTGRNLLAPLMRTRRR
ncbi:phosphoglycerate mutase (2,3-diphosphoglycerate-independent) [Candidatus Woesebacteria bacterium RIFCSPHIGHO2_01_FULL_44_21]|uniref:2,3-bisphosphoglycerate-independent phosphoglycerate mutase n=1 Tax=Candidatus Woesebacteria bacterium RIFCSPHIGHO2_01_FULL_44_21 TaxID=1802503 RepID=A0A1F7YZY4_9BACT|nr:MAG: phosphoglycerate mutase (2,3-diphosphoglycerate-independent) [Candidatus Woesebacteria bacterium RIFCSPHIGHO2_01_FULL_44_21]OGM71173.1 MAG: phosphoglycerate mutase (2,3-diphosphoglycerate-independent) [Candidatus Woesebacteria bacterium RIFCSPLOWO2_01_FULL_44_24b]